jgi:glutathione synthase/RimK-type ligase-like ATP-grasp enzyme
MILVISSKNSYATQRLVKEAKGKKLEVRVMDIQDLIAVNFKVQANGFDILYVRNPYLNQSAQYLPNIIKLAKTFKAAGKRVVDANISSGFLGKGKWKDYQVLKKAGLPIPETYKYEQKIKFSKTHPKSYFLKWIYGFRGKGIFTVKSDMGESLIPNNVAKAELMHQEFIVSDYEYKVMCVGYKSLPVVLKFGMDKMLRPDFKNFKVLKKTTCNNVVALAEKSAKVLGRELSKIDILEKDGKFYILEVNRFPGFKSFEQLTKFNVAKEFLKYLMGCSK